MSRRRGIASRRCLAEAGARVTERQLFRRAAGTAGILAGLFRPRLLQWQGSLSRESRKASRRCAEADEGRRTQKNDVGEPFPHLGQPPPGGRAPLNGGRAPPNGAGVPPAGKSSWTGTAPGPTHQNRRFLVPQGCRRLRIGGGPLSIERGRVARVSARVGCSAFGSVSRARSEQSAGQPARAWTVVFRRRLSEGTPSERKTDVEVPGERWRQRYQTIVLKRDLAPFSQESFGAPKPPEAGMHTAGPKDSGHRPKSALSLQPREYFATVRPLLTWILKGRKLSASGALELFGVSTWWWGREAGCRKGGGGRAEYEGWAHR